MYIPPLLFDDELWDWFGEEVAKSIKEEIKYERKYLENKEKMRNLQSLKKTK